jgi:hypothetical protein
MFSVCFTKKIARLHTGRQCPEKAFSSLKYNSILILNYLFKDYTLYLKQLCHHFFNQFCLRVYLGDSYAQLCCRSHSQKGIFRDQLHMTKFTFNSKALSHKHFKFMIKLQI